MTLFPGCHFVHRILVGDRLVVLALDQQGGDDPFDLRGGQNAFEGGREALFI
jgi:hypothetical protein